MTDWWGNAAVILSGIITACASIGAVMYTNFKTKKQLEDQERKHDRDRKVLEQQNRFVIIKPSHRLITLSQLLDSLIISNDYNRILLFSGEDGFEFYDNIEKQNGQRLRILLIENKSGNDIQNISISSCANLKNINTNESITYKANNHTFLLRSGESIVIRLNNQTQFDRIIEMNQAQIPSDLDFECTIEYDTMAAQTIKYLYHISIRNDRVIDVISDGIISVDDTKEQKKNSCKQTSFRNLQDSISAIDRSAYAWRKMSEAQVQTFLSYMPKQQSSVTNTEDNPTENEIENGKPQ